jgi:FkbM family methyltransferase
MLTPNFIVAAFKTFLNISKTRRMALLKGLRLTLRSMGPKWVAKEITRRIAGIPYTYSGILVKDDVTFRAIRNLVSKGSVWRQKDMVFFRSKLGIFAVPYKNVQLLYSLGAEDFEMMYGYLDVKDKTVADIGAYLGETTVLFARMGARHIHAYEPLFFEYVEFNLKLNNITNATVHPYGVFIEEDTYGVAITGSGSGLLAGSTQIKVMPIEEAIADVVKMDCEGCEWSLLSIPCDVIKRAEEYAIEIHGPEPLIVRKLEKCGFLAKLCTRLAPQISIWHFKMKN